MLILCGNLLIAFNEVEEEIEEEVKAEGEMEEMKDETIQDASEI